MYTVCVYTHIVIVFHFLSCFTKHETNCARRKILIIINRSNGGSSNLFLFFILICIFFLYDIFSSVWPIFIALEKTGVLLNYYFRYFVFIYIYIYIKKSFHLINFI